MSSESKVSGKVIAAGLSWKFAERILAQGISTLVSIILARLLLPEEYGLVTMVLIFINIANVFVTSGFGQSLIQERNAGDLEFSTITYVSITVAILLYGVLFVCASIIEAFYNILDLAIVIRVLGLKLIISGYNSIQQAYVQKTMQFRKFFFSTLGGTLISGIVGVVLAYNGFGVWALVAQYLVNSTIDTIVLQITIHWRPRLVFSIKCAKRLISYSWKLTVGDLVSTVYNELRSLVIGKFYTPQDLAYFNKGEQFPKLIITNVSTSIISVLYPAMSLVNDSVEELKDITRKSMRASSFCVFPILIGLATVATPFVSLLLTDKWLPCVIYMQLSCFSNVTTPLSSANLQALKAIGRSDIVMYLEIIKKSIGLFLIFATIKYGVLMIAISGLIYSIVALVVNAYPNKKFLGYGYMEQLKDILPFAVASIIMGGVVLLVGFLRINLLIKLITQIVVGMIVYVVVMKIGKNEIYINLENLLFGKIFKKR